MCYRPMYTFFFNPPVARSTPPSVLKSLVMHPIQVGQIIHGNQGYSLSSGLSGLWVSTTTLWGWYGIQRDGFEVIHDEGKLPM